MTQSHPPKLNLQINVPTTFSLPFGDYKEVTGQYGMSFLYAVDVDGVRHGLFADVKLHQAMLNAGTGPGVELTVTKTQESYEKDGEQRRFNTFIVEGGTGTPTQAAPAGNAVAAPPTPPPAVDGKETFKLMMHHFKRCIAQAEKTYTDCGYKIDKSSPDAINAAAATLFIQTCKSLDLRALSQPQAAPAPTPAPPPSAPASPPPAEPAPPAAAPANNEYGDDLPF
jgi:hypothetical protein